MRCEDLMACGSWLQLGLDAVTDFKVPNRTHIMHLIFVHDARGFFGFPF